MADNLRSKAFSGVAWKLIERFSVEIFGFIVGIILARKLDPSDYGLVAMTAIFFSISYLLIDAGFSTALVRKKDRTEIDYSTAYLTNVVLSLLFSILLVLGAPWMARFYGEPRLVSIVCVNALIVFLGSFIAVQNVRLSINLEFKKQSVINVVCSIVNGLLAIIMALAGYGYWALIIPSGIVLFLRGALYWKAQRWFPKLAFSLSSFKEMFSFGFKIMITAIIKAAYANIYSLVIGKKYNATDLGYYNRGNSYALLPSNTVANTLGSVSYPILSKINDDPDRLSSAYRRMIGLAGYVVFPIMIGLAVLARPFVIVLVTDKWEACVPYLQVLCFALMWEPIHSLNYNLLQTTGRADLRLRVEVIQKILCVVVLFITIPRGILIMCFGSVAVAVLSLLINTYYTGKLINVGFVSQMKDLLPSLSLSLVMGFVVWICTKSMGSVYVQLLVGIPLGIAIYWGLSKIVKSKNYDYMLLLLRENVFDRLKK